MIRQHVFSKVTNTMQSMYATNRSGVGGRKLNVAKSAVFGLGIHRERLARESLVIRYPLALRAEYGAAQSTSDAELQKMFIRLG